MQLSDFVARHNSDLARGPKRSRELYMEKNTEKLKLVRIVLKRLQTPQYKHKLCTQQEKVSRFCYFCPSLFSLRSLYSYTKSYNNAVTQCHVDGSQRSLVYALPVRDPDYVGDRTK